MMQACEERLCSNACSTNGFTSCSKGSSTRMPTDPGAPLLFAPSLAACISPRPPPVTMSQPSEAKAAAARFTSS